MRRALTISIVPIAALSLLAACGGGSQSPVKSARAGDRIAAVPAPAKVANPPVVAAPTAGGDAAVQAPPATAPAQVAASTSSGPATAPAAGTTGALAQGATEAPSPISAAVDRPCLHPGDTQGVTVRSEPGGAVVFDTVYADHTDELTSKYGSGSGSGQADGSGVFHVTWAVPANAPAGQATVNVGGTFHRDIARAATTFLIKPAGQGC